ncbi:Alpha/Beta hydrolase protein [Coniochaeta sp. 2T2.1]|nr:Alpha/Beta hydrolase protein [Coniochaeta sp. 2T2.1]
MLFCVLRILGAAALLSLTARAGKTQSVSNWGDNPSGLPAMLVYTPGKIAEKPAIILGLHPCSGTGQMYQSITPLPSYANKLTYNGDPSKVFVVDGSSGAMEAHVLAATYPEVFAGAASYSGVPAACWAGSPMSTPMCPRGDLARVCNPDYNGTRPKMMIVHGTAYQYTAVVISLLKAQLDQWSDVLGLCFVKNVSNDPIANWKKIVYGDGTQLVGYEVQGGGHIPAFQGDATLRFIGFL